MASELQETLARIVTKSEVLVEKYHVLSAEKERLEKIVAQLQEEKENNQLLTDNEYLTIVRKIVPDSEHLGEAKNMISSIVRDIDKCISQLNE